AVLLARASGTGDIAIGTPVAGRGGAGLGGRLGMLVKSLVVGTQVYGGGCWCGRRAAGGLLCAGGGRAPPPPPRHDKMCAGHRTQLADGAARCGATPGLSTPPESGCISGVTV
ncbi:hypothetical protein, partial [Nocardia brasiliensis]|uniref:hypothetical protein n=1 Tax=Nocardia brasiliensis TaxID=37326 RepID=UPI002455EE79